LIERLGRKILRRRRQVQPLPGGWINLDLIWAVALVGTGLATLVL
jgi:hypothetical protein